MSRTLTRTPLIHDDMLAERPHVPTWLDWFQAAGIPMVGEPPTVTVCSLICICAKVGASAPTSASEAAVTNIPVRECYVLLHLVLRRASGLQRRYEQRGRRMQAILESFSALCTLLRMRVRVERGLANGPATYRFVSLPVAITGPVGRPVGEPPGGSSETASVASGVTRPARLEGMLSRIG